jgi:putative transposase
MITKKIKINPTKYEKETFDFWIRRCKYLYNVALTERIYYYQATGKSLNVYEQKKELVSIKEMDSSWKDIPNKALQEVIFRLDKAYKSFFKSGGFPKYKNNDTFNSIEFVKTDVRIKNNLVYLPKLKKGIKGYEEFPLKYNTVRLLKENNNYFLCFYCENEIITKEINNGVVGCDLGLKTLMTDSKGNEIKRFSTKLTKKYANRIADLNKSLATKKRGSNRRKKVKKQLNKTHNRLKNSRNDYLHKVSTKYIKNTDEDTIVIGDLTVNNLIKKSKTVKQTNINRSYNTSSIKIFVSFMLYKGIREGKIVKIVGEEYTSKTCSCCNKVKHELKVKDRVFNCIDCGLTISRDINGAINIRKIYLDTFRPIGIDLTEVKYKHSLLKNGSVRATIVI